MVLLEGMLTFELTDERSRYPMFCGRFHRRNRVHFGPPVLPSAIAVGGRAVGFSQYEGRLVLDVAHHLPRTKIGPAIGVYAETYAKRHSSPIVASRRLLREVMHRTQLWNFRLLVALADDITMRRKSAGALTGLM